MKFLPKDRDRLDTPAFHIAEPVDLPIERGLAGSGLLAETVVRRLGDHMPLHRLQKIYAREGVVLSKSTMCGWHKALDGLCRPLVEAMWSDALAMAPYLCTDATGVLVRDQKKCRRGHFWVVIAPGRHEDDGQQPLVPPVGREDVQMLQHVIAHALGLAEQKNRVHVAAGDFLDLVAQGPKDADSGGLWPGAPWAKTREDEGTQQLLGADVFRSVPSTLNSLRHSSAGPPRHDAVRRAATSNAHRTRASSLRACAVVVQPRSRRSVLSAVDPQHLAPFLVLASALMCGCQPADTDPSGNATSTGSSAVSEEGTLGEASGESDGGLDSATGGSAASRSSAGESMTGDSMTGDGMTSDSTTSDSTTSDNSTRDSESSTGAQEWDGPCPQYSGLAQVGSLWETESNPQFEAETNSSYTWAREIVSVSVGAETAVTMVATLTFTVAGGTSVVTLIHDYVCDEGGAWLQSIQTEQEGAVTTTVYDPAWLVMPWDVVAGSQWETTGTVTVTNDSGTTASSFTRNNTVVAEVSETVIGVNYDCLRIDWNDGAGDSGWTCNDAAAGYVSYNDPDDDFVTIDVVPW